GNPDWASFGSHTIDLSSLSLADGTYTLRAQAFDSATSSSTVDKTFVVDSNAGSGTAPTSLSMTLSADSFASDGTLTFANNSAWVYDADEDQTSIDFTIYNGSTTVTSGIDLTNPADLVDHTNPQWNKFDGFEINLDNVNSGSDLAPGEYTLSAEVYDAQGNTSEIETVTFTIEGANTPEIPIMNLSKTSFDPTSESLSFASNFAWVNDDDGFSDIQSVDFQIIDSTGSTVSDAGIDYTFTGSSPTSGTNFRGFYEHTIDISGLADGDYTLQATPYDASGAGSSLTRNFTVDDPANIGAVSNVYDLTSGYDSFGDSDYLLISDFDKSQDLIDISDSGSYSLVEVAGGSGSLPYSGTYIYESGDLVGIVEDETALDLNDSYFI
ncbi:MAG: hypothetical protein D6756_08440, partial [Cyanobacteria bacterium J083]